MYKVFKVGEKWQIFWCPSAPHHYNDRVPVDGREYDFRQAAYRRCKQLQDRRTREDKIMQRGSTESVA